MVIVGGIVCARFGVLGSLSAVLTLWEEAEGDFGADDLETEVFLGVLGAMWR
jgi:hypothetical protein